MINCTGGKPQKMSKRDQDPNQVNKDGAALNGLLSKRSQHFAIGTQVIFAGERYLVVAYKHDSVLLYAEDGSKRTVKNPYFMQWR